MSNMNEPSDWWQWGSSDGEKREIAALRAWKDDVLWLALNAPARAWARGAMELAKQRAETESPAWKGRSWCEARSLVFCVQKAMPKKEPTPQEIAELRRLIALAVSEPSRPGLLNLALTNPAWYLHTIGRYVSEYCGSPI